MKKLIFLSLILVLFTAIIYPQTVQNYFSKGSLLLNDKNSWSTTRDGTGPSPSSLPAANQAFFIQNTHTMYFNADINLNNNPLTIESGGGLNFNGYILNGNSAASFILSSGGKIYIGSPQGIAITGAIGNVQTSGARTFDAGANYEYSGTSAQVTGPGLPAAITGNLTFNNTFGVTLSQSISVSGIITMTAGNVITGINILTLSNSSPSSLVRTNGYIIGIFARAVSVSGGSFLFPLGIAGTPPQYLGRMVTISYISNPVNAGTLTIKHISGDPMGNVSGLNDNGYWLDTYSRVGFWQVDQTLPALGGIYDLSINAEGFTGVDDYTTLRIMRRNDSGSNWSLNGTHSAGTGTNENPTANRTECTAFSQFAIASNWNDNPLDGPLPVVMSSFNSSVSRNNVRLTWTTESEINNKGFEIQRMKNNDRWVLAGFVRGSGNSTSPKTYTYSDNSLDRGVYKYRLKQIDYNGSTENFDLRNDVVIASPSRYLLSQNYPNPFNPSTSISFEIPKDDYVSLSVYDITGREVLKLVDGYKTAGYYRVEFDGSSFPSGIYFYQFRTAEFTKVVKMLLLK